VASTEGVVERDPRVVLRETRVVERERETEKVVPYETIS